MASFTKKVETSDNHQRIATEALELANKENASLNQQVWELNTRVSATVEEVEVARNEVESADSEAEKRYIANFHLIKRYQNFGSYW